MIKAIIFDCFGVLIADAIRPKADEIAKKDPAVGDTVYGIMRELDLGLISPDQGFKELASVLQMTPADVADLSKKGEVRNVSFIEQIPPLKKQFKIGLLSNVQSKHWLEARFLPGELNELFDVVIASGDVGMVKPDPGIYQLMASRLGVQADECVMIDDRPSGIEGAIAAGMKAIHFLNNNQATEELQSLIDNRGETD
jgi:epoxide hydrolase-like predicted phosphatase